MLRADRFAAVVIAAGPLHIVVNTTGVGRAVIDMLRAAGFDPLVATIRAGPSGRRQGREINIPKSALLLPLVVAVEARRLNVVASCSLRDTLGAELASFRRAAGPQGRLLITQSSAGHHGDLGIAVALALLGKADWDALAARVATAERRCRPSRRRTGRCRYLPATSFGRRSASRC